MKGSSAPATVASLPPDDFRQNSLGVTPFGDNVTVVSMRGENIIVRGQRRADTDTGCFLPDVNVKVAANETFVDLVEADDMLFSAPNHEHFAQNPEPLFR